MMKLAELLAMNPHPDESFVLDEVTDLTPAQRGEWEAKRAARNAAFAADRKTAKAEMAEFDRDLAERTRSHNLEHQAPGYEYPKSE